MSIPTKTKTIYPLSVAEAKRHLRIPENEEEDNDYIDNLIKAATQQAESYIGKDIALTSNVDTIYDFCDDSINILEGNFNEFTSGITDTSISVDVNNVQKMYNYTLIELNSDYSADPLTISYITGFSEGECPAVIKHAILIKVADLYDVERQSYTEGSIKKNKAFESLLDSYRLIIF